MLIMVGTASLAISFSTGAVVIRIRFASVAWAELSFAMAILRAPRARPQSCPRNHTFVPRQYTTLLRAFPATPAAFPSLSVFCRLGS